MSEPVPERVRILDKEYIVACRAEERDALRDSARMLDQKMREIRDGGKIIGTERIAVMAALNIAYELLVEKGGEHRQNEVVNARLRAIQERIEAVLDQDDDRQIKL